MIALSPARVRCWAKSPRTEKRMPRCILSARVSTEDQAASGLGIDAQIHACRVWAERAGRPVVGPFVDDGVSGATGLDKRPALLEALAQLEPGDVLLVAKR